MRDLGWTMGVVWVWVWVGQAGAAAPGERALDVEINAAGCVRHDALVDVPVDFETLATKSGAAMPLTARSVNVVEVSLAGRIVDRATPFQFNCVGRGLGTLSILLGGRTQANATRHFRVSFRQAGKTFTARKVRPRIEVVKDYEHQGLDSFRIVTPSAWWYYHKQGAGFAGLWDANGNDWIGYRPKGGSAGHYRGIPNLVHPEGYFHPGGAKCTSTLLADGPLKAIIQSRSKDGKWACRWDITDAWARLTVLKAAHPYWFLYEGTPGGKLDTSRQFCVRCDGMRTPAAQRWTSDLPGDEWVYFADAKLRRALVLVHHHRDEHVDSYWPMQNNMTVFGFGRKGLTKHMTQVPAQFTVGFCESTDPKVVAAAIAAITRPPKVTVRAKPKPRK